VQIREGQLTPSPFNVARTALPGLGSIRALRTREKQAQSSGSGTVLQQRSVVGPLYHRIAVAVAAMPKMLSRFKLGCSLYRWLGFALASGKGWANLIYKQHSRVTPIERCLP
jgi:hypothetical protein